MEKLKFECRECKRTEEFSSEQMAKTAGGWRDLEIAGHSGPWAEYYFGLCSGCSPSDMYYVYENDDE